MASTLTWNVAGPFTKTGTTVGACWTDLVALINTKSADANFKWQVASSNVASTPYHIVLKPKAGGAGRILLVQWTSAPAGNNAAILQTAPAVASAYAAYFPNGNVDTPSNLSAASGTILGNDTGCTLVAAVTGSATSYASTYEWWYADSDEGCLFWTGLASSNNSYLFGAGLLTVDGADTAYASALGGGSVALSSFGASSGGLFNWSGGGVLAGSVGTSIQVNYGGSKKYYGAAYSPVAWSTQSYGAANDILSDTGTNKAWFVPVQLLGTTKGEGFVLKLRQIAFGPGTLAGPSTQFSTTGPVVAARCVNTGTSASQSLPWLTNFKL